MSMQFDNIEQLERLNIDISIKSLVSAILRTFGVNSNFRKIVWDIDDKHHLILNHHRCPDLFNYSLIITAH